MLFFDLIQETSLSIFSNKARSGLTILGIVIGIASVITMIAIGQGAQASIESSIRSIGSNLLTIIPGAQTAPGKMVSSGRGSAQSLTLEDVRTIEEIKSIKAIAPEISSGYQIIGKGTNTYTSVIGTTFSYLQVKNIEIEIGSFVSDQDIIRISKVIVLGPVTRDDLFGENIDPIGKKVKINQIIFTVIGVTKSKGGSGFANQDDIAFIPLSTAKSYLTGEDYLSAINVEVKSEDLMTSTEEEITSLLLASHNISDPLDADFSIFNQADILETVSQATGIFTVFLGAIASISLIVGGIGIMNMMLTTVTERTREIGLRKAIGAKDNEIGLQFLFEAILLTFIGGILGILIGCALSLIIAKFSTIDAVIAPWSIFLAFSVSALIGIIFGYYPARRAAKLSPIEALRYE